MSIASIRTTVRDKGQVTLPSKLRALLHVEAGDDIEFALDEATGVVTVTGLKTIRADQAWFWDLEWQRKEAEASTDVEAGRVTRFQDGESFLESLT